LTICTLFYSLIRERIFKKGEFTAIIESAPEGGFWAICPEILGANGQGETIEQAKESLNKAIIFLCQESQE
jgi:predicted RNase H-like HicB family nuclease